MNMRECLQDLRGSVIQGVEFLSDNSVTLCSYKESTAQYFKVSMSGGCCYNSVIRFEDKDYTGYNSEFNVVLLKTKGEQIADVVGLPESVAIWFGYSESFFLSIEKPFVINYTCWVI